MPTDFSRLGKVYVAPIALFWPIACAASGGSAPDFTATTGRADSGTTDSGTTDSDSTCAPPADGVMPPGSWTGWAGDYNGFTINEDGSVLFVECGRRARVERATVVDGAVDWLAAWTWRPPHDSGDEVVEGRVTGTFCGDHAELLWEPGRSGGVEPYDRVENDQMPPTCD